MAINTILEGTPPACIYISGDPKYHDMLQEMIKNGQLFEHPAPGAEIKQWLWFIFSNPSWNIDMILKMVHKADCMIVYFQPSDDISASLVEIGVFLALNKEVIICGQGTCEPLEQILKYQKCILRENFPDAINYARSLYYQ